MACGRDKPHETGSAGLRSWVFELWLALFVAAPVFGATPPPPAVAFVGVWDRALPMLAEAGQELGVRTVARKPAELVEELRANPASSYAVIFLLNLDSKDAVALKESFLASSAANPGRKLIPLDKRAVHAELDKAGLLTSDINIPKYWRPNGETNIRRLLNYTAITYLGRQGQIEPPVLVPDYGLYDPEREEPFSTFESCRGFKADRHRWKPGMPVAAILIQQSFWVTHDTKVIDAQVYALEKCGVNAVVIFGDSQAQVTGLLKETHPDLIVEDRHGAMWESPQLLEELDVPYLRPVSMLGYTLDEWLADPQGLSHRDVGMFMTLQESWGTIEPVVIGGLKANLQGYRLHEPYPSGVDKFARRAAAWLKLRSKPNAEKRVALIYYNKGLGKDDLMRGSPTGAFLDGPESLVRFLPRLQQRGFTVTKLPKDVDELVGWMRKDGHLLAPWMQGELEALVDSGSPVLIPLSRYQQWFEQKLSPANQKAVIDAFGPPPGRIMVVERQGEKCIVIPRIELGNVLLAPQPERGETMDDKLLHSRDVPPPHNYLAFYWWLEEEAKADVVVHWGTHGSLELLPGKEAGLTRDCWTDICVGNMPVVNLWIMDNLGEATLSRRRSYALLVDHMVPPAINASAADKFTTLQDEFDKYHSLEEGLLKAEYRKRIVGRIREEKLDEELGIKTVNGAISESDLGRVGEHIDYLFEARTPLTLHVLGQPPAPECLTPYLVSILGKPFLGHLERALHETNRPSSEVQKRLWLEKRGAEFLKAAMAGQSPAGVAITGDLQKDVEFAKDVLGRLNRADGEITGLLRALEGRYVQPGPGPEPIRNPNSVPGGRNLYALNPEEIPTRPAWEVAVQLVDEMLKTKHPKKIGFDLNGMETMRDFGVMEAQILYLMGVRPVWDRNNLAIDVELIPREELKRPRIDVFVAMGGMYKENFPTRVELLDKAVRLASSAREADNSVREGTASMESRLEAAGMAHGQALQLAGARIFGTKPGNMSGTKILYLVPRSGVWDKEDEIADVYIDNMSYVYTKGAWGQKVAGLYEQAIQGTDLLVRVWASNMTSQLSNHHAYEYLGGLSMAVKKLTGKEPEAVIADVRDPNGARMRDFQEVLATTLQAELLNRKWVEGMKQHGYAGAGHAAELVKNTFGWSVTRPGSIADVTWSEIQSVYIDDKYKLGLRDWFEKENPHALAELAATLLEAGRTGHWNANPQALRELSRLYGELAAKYGESGGLVSGGNTKLQEFITRQLTAPGDAAGAALAAKFSAAIEQAAGAAANKPASPPKAMAAAATVAKNIVGQKLALAEQPAAPSVDPVEEQRVIYLRAAAGAAVLLAGLGFLGRKGAM